MHKMLNQPYHIISQFPLELILDELGDGGADQAVMTLTREGSDKPVAAVALFRGMDVSTYLQALDRVSEDETHAGQKSDTALQQLLTVAEDMADELRAVVQDAEQAGCQQQHLIELLGRFESVARQYPAYLVRVVGDDEAAEAAG